MLAICLQYACNMLGLPRYAWGLFLDLEIFGARDLSFFKSPFKKPCLELQIFIQKSFKKALYGANGVTTWAT